MSLHDPVEPLISKPATGHLAREQVHISDGRSPHIIESQAAFQRDLPHLLQRHTGRWVAYHGPTQVGLAHSKAELYQQCLARGLKKGEFLVRSIEPVDAAATELLFDQ
jgi:hypothetical protein